MRGVPRWLTNAITWAYHHSPTWALTLWVVLAAVVTLGLVVSLALSWKRKGRSAKLGVGFGSVQIGMSYVLLTGVYQFWQGRLHMVAVEAAIIALFVESLAWMLAGFVHEHGKQADSEGFGPAGPLFWAVITGGGILAVLGSASTVTSVGRIVVVAMAGCAWHLRLCTWTRRATTRSRWVWTPKRLLIAVGALAPDDGDLLDNPDEWTIRRLARALRWRNSRQPWQWMGSRMLARRADATPGDLLAAAMRRHAEADLIIDHGFAKSPAMLQIRERVSASQLAAATAPSKIEQLDEQIAEQAARADAEQARADRLEQAASRLRADYEQTVSSLREQVEQAQRAATEQATRADREQAGRLLAEQDAQAARAAQRRGEQAREQGERTAQVSSMRSDEQIADDLAEQYRDLLEQTGEPMTAYQIRKAASVSDKRAPRVLALLASRYPSRVREQGASSPIEQGSRADSDDDQENAS